MKTRDNDSQKRARSWCSGSRGIAFRAVTPLILALTFTVTANSQWNPLNPVVDVVRQDDGVVFTMETGRLQLQVCSPSIIRVRYSPATTLPDRPDHVIVKTGWAPVKWTMDTTAGDFTLVTSALKVSVTRKNGTITFRDLKDQKLFADDGRTLTPVEVNGEKTYHAELFSNLWGSYEAFYGLGQHQAGTFNFRGEAVDLSQENTNISIPFVLSSKGYGIYWNNNSRSRFNNRFLNALYISSEVADVIDYYFLYGPEFDTLIAGYRTLTGGVPMFGKWAYGFWQCKNRYKTQAELLEVAHTYRKLRIPLDNIVQDWFWWYTMGEPVFDASRYPDPKGMIDDLHKNRLHVMFSFWPYFRPGTKTYEDMDKRGFFIDRTKSESFHPVGQALYDPFNPDARRYYWKLIDTSLFRIGVDAWWLDTTEPETEGREASILMSNTTAAGNGARLANLYPLMTTSALYEGQRAATDRKRVFILSRSASAGTQRNAAAVWSGDVNSDWTFFKKQIPAGLNYSMSGLPYWTTDIGGFLIGDPEDPAYRELFVRWFQFGAFNPIFRVHGTRTNDHNELWSYGPEAQKILVSFDRLRYRLLPYIYSLAWMTTSASYTLMRGLVMDFRSDPRVADIGDQFMFGPSLLVNPVTEPGAVNRRLYLPRAKWYDFWTGKRLEGGRAIDASAPLQLLPLYVRAGSILPMGPHIEWATEKPADALELRIYRGADGEFILYEDENDSYDYEKGIHATIRFHWDDKGKKLTIGDRQGKFPGMLNLRTFHIVFVRENHGAGIDPEKKPDRLVRYEGKEITVAP